MPGGPGAFADGNTGGAEGLYEGGWNGVGGPVTGDSYTGAVVGPGSETPRAGTTTAVLQWGQCTCWPPMSEVTSNTPEQVGHES